MPDKKPPIKTERSRRGTVTPSTGTENATSDDATDAADDDHGPGAPGAPDLDERERRQSARRKAPGPGGPARPAPRPSRDDEAADVEPEPWGCDPTAMPPTEPVDPSS